MEMDKITESIYEGARLEAIWSKRQIIPERWEDRDEKFRNQMVDIVGKYLSAEKLPTPEEAHDSWTESYVKMGWKYGEKRDTQLKTHPDMLPYDELQQDEKDKDAIFLALVWVAKELLPSKKEETK